MDERDEPVRHETTVINAGSGDSGGGGGLLLGVILVLIIGVAAFLYFGGYIGHGDANRDININANIKAPDINITPPSAPPANPPAGNSTQ
jgi:hypothetical protein